MARRSSGLANMATGHGGRWGMVTIRVRWADDIHVVAAWSIGQ
jgi:hypothetical protein